MGRRGVGRPEPIITVGQAAGAARKRVSFVSVRWQLSQATPSRQLLRSLVSKAT